MAIEMTIQVVDRATAGIQEIVAACDRIKLEIAINMQIAISEISDAPWDRGEWHGSFLTLDETATHDLVRADVAALVAYGETPDGWDGSSAGTAGIVITHDGRVISWESDWGPWGSGFSADAYGGGADISCSTRIAVALSGMSEQSRELLVWQPYARQYSARIDELLWVARDAETDGKLDDAASIIAEAVALALDGTT